MNDSQDTQFDWSGRRVVVVADFDSFLRAATYYTKLLREHGATIEHKVAYARERQLSDEQLAACGLRAEDVEIAKLADIAKDARVHGADVVLLALNGLRTRRFAVAFHDAARKNARRPALVSFYPGILFRFHLEGMMSRSSSDLFLLNSPHDHDMYVDALTSMDLDASNGVLMGLPMLPSATQRREHVAPERGDILFVGQPTVPSGRMERMYTLERLLELARRYPDLRVVIKPRHRPNETTLHRMKFHYEDLLRDMGESRPPNLHVSYDSMPTCLDRAGVVLTYSSTAAIESAVLGIPTRVLTDLGIHENIGNHFFLGSGLFASFDDVVPELEHRIEAAWEARHVLSANDRHDEFLSALATRVQRCQSPKAEDRRPPNGRLFSRARAYEDYVVDQFGRASLPEFGHRNAAETKLQRARRRLRSLRRFAALLTERRR